MFCFCELVGGEVVFLVCFVVVYVFCCLLWVVIGFYLVRVDRDGVYVFIRGCWWFWWFFCCEGVEYFLGVGVDDVVCFVFVYYECLYVFYGLFGFGVEVVGD